MINVVLKPKKEIQVSLKPEQGIQIEATKKYLFDPAIVQEYVDASAENATKAEEQANRAEQTVADVSAFVDTSKSEITGIIEQGKTDIATAIDDGRMEISDSILGATEEVKKTAVDAANEAINDAAVTATSIVVDYANNEIKPLLNEIASNAAESAENASESAGLAANESGNAAISATDSQHYAEDSRIWAEGSDSEVKNVDGEHSSKGWATLAKQSETNAKSYADSINPATLVNIGSDQTITGNKTFTKPIIARMNTVEENTPPAQNQYIDWISPRDKNGANIGFFGITDYADGRRCSRIGHTRTKSDGSRVYPEISVGTKLDGTVFTAAPAPSASDNSNQIATTAWVNTKVASSLPAGTILSYGGSTAPSGFLLCDGAKISRTTYANLFKAIGTTYGTGDGSTTFNIPNLTNAKVLKGSNISVKGSGKTIGLTKGTENYGLTFAWFEGYIRNVAYQNAYDTNAGTAISSGGSVPGASGQRITMGLTTDGSKSGMVADLSSGVSVKYIIKY